MSAKIENDISAPDEFTWYVQDGLGSVIGEVDEDGVFTTPTIKYDVYGAVRNQGGVSSDRGHRFVGSLGHTSEDTNLIYMRARYYDPNVGRFISEDKARDGINWYAYCDNNPVNLVDPDGCMVAPVIAAYVLIAAAAIVLFMDFYYAFVGYDKDPRNSTDETGGDPRRNREERRRGVPPPGWGPTWAPGPPRRISTSDVGDAVQGLADVRSYIYELALLM